MKYVIAGVALLGCLWLFMPARSASSFNVDGMKVFDHYAYDYYPPFDKDGVTHITWSDGSGTTIFHHYSAVESMIPGQSYPVPVANR